MEQFGAIGLGEGHSIYQEVEASNGSRHYDFLLSMIDAANKRSKPELTHALIKAINFHAIAGLHSEAGSHRTVQVSVGSGVQLAHHTEVPSEMNGLINLTNTVWGTVPFMSLAAYVLWRLTRIHPFVNGNGRTARAVCYYIVSASMGRLLPGNPILPEQFRMQHSEYIDRLQIADAGNLEPLTQLTTQLLNKQLASTPPVSPSSASVP